MNLSPFKTICIALVALGGYFVCGAGHAQGTQVLPSVLEGVTLGQIISRDGKPIPGIRVVSSLPGTDNESLEVRLFYKPSKVNPALPFTQHPSRDNGPATTSHQIIALPYVVSGAEDRFKLDDLTSGPLVVQSVFWFGTRRDSWQAYQWVSETCSELQSSLSAAPKVQSDIGSQFFSCVFEQDSRALAAMTTVGGGVSVVLSSIGVTRTRDTQRLSALVRRERSKAILSSDINRP